MSPGLLRVAVVAGLAALGCAPALSAPANTLRDLFSYLGGCMNGIAGEPGAELTIAFSLKRDGALLGKPHIAFSKLPSDSAERDRFLDNVAARFGACLPAPVSDALGGAIAGRRLTIRLAIPRREISS